MLYSSLLFTPFTYSNYTRKDIVSREIYLVGCTNYITYVQSLPPATAKPFTIANWLQYAGKHFEDSEERY